MNVDSDTRIAELNDAFRTSGTSYTLTSGVLELPDVMGLVDAVRGFNDFDSDNDPYQQHNFGVLSWHGQYILWKIDYYDQDLKYGTDPLDPECNRVLTVLLAREY